jgi:predicted RNA-binding protein YlqC (UPF0109 family)
MFESSGRPCEDDADGRVRELFLQLALRLVEEKETVTVEKKLGGDGVTLVLTVAPGDLGRVIGKHGRTVRALRTLLQAATRELGQVYVLAVETAPIS